MRSWAGWWSALTRNPRCEDSNAELLRRFDRAAELAARLIGDFDRVVESGQAKDPIYGRTFDPKPEQEAANA